MGVSFTCDTWTALSKLGYIAVTGHYLDNDWQLKSKCLVYKHLGGSHTAVAIGRVLMV